MKTLLVSELSDSLLFLSDSQDVQTVKDYLGEKSKEFDSFFVKIGDGDYEEVWGIHGIIPNLGKIAYQLHP